MVYFVETHWNELLKFSRRTENSIRQWANRYGITGDTKTTYKSAKDKYSGRYVAVNLLNTNTIELRLFRGTLRYETFIATLQLVDEICNLAIRLTDAELENLSWSDFVLGLKQKALIRFLREKQLFVNKKIKEEEEL